MRRLRFFCLKCLQFSDYEIIAAVLPDEGRLSIKCLVRCKHCAGEIFHEVPMGEEVEDEIIMQFNPERKVLC